MLGESNKDGLKAKFLLGDDIYVANSVRVINSTAVANEITISDHSNFYHFVEQVISVNSTDYRQVVRDNEKEVLSLTWDREKKLNFTTIEL